MPEPWLCFPVLVHAPVLADGCQVDSGWSTGMPEQGWGTPPAFTLCFSLPNAT